MKPTSEIIPFPLPSPPKGKHLQSKIIYKYIINNYKSCWKGWSWFRTGRVGVLWGDISPEHRKFSLLSLMAVYFSSLRIDGNVTILRQPPPLPSHPLISCWKHSKHLNLIFKIASWWFCLLFFPWIPENLDSYYSLKPANLNKGSLKHRQNEAKIISISQMHCLICTLHYWY